jgi:hypothetical protein
MKISTTQARNLAPTISKLMGALVFASVMSGLAVTPALSENNQRHDEPQDRGNHRAPSHTDRDRHAYHQPHYYPQPVYAPPPVYYVPQPSPGISVFLPLQIHIP